MKEESPTPTCVSQPVRETYDRMVNDILALSHIPRWSTVPHVRSQSVAEHSFAVAAIALALCSRMGLELDRDSLIYALLHDVEEAATGDTPSYYKRDFPVSSDYVGYRPTVDPKLRKVVKLADLIEAYTFIARYGMGDHAASVTSAVRQDLDAYIRKYDNLFDHAQIWNLITTIRTEGGRLRR